MMIQHAPIAGPIDIRIGQRPAGGSRPIFAVASRQNGGPPCPAPKGAPHTIER